MKNINIILEDGYTRKEPIIVLRRNDVDKNNYLGNNKIFVEGGDKPLFNLCSNTVLENLDCVCVEKVYKLNNNISFLDKVKYLLTNNFKYIVKE